MSTMIFNGVVGLAVVGLGLLVVFSRKRTVVHWTFLFLSVLTAAWSLFNAVIQSGILMDERYLNIVARLMLASAFTISVVFLFFTWIFPKKTLPISKNHLLIVAIPFIGIVSLLMFSQIILSGVEPGKGLSEVLKINKSGYLFFTLFFLMNFIWGITSIIRKYLKFTGLDRTQIIYIGLGLGLAIGMGAIFNVILPAAGKMQFVSLTPLYPFVFIGFTSYAIMRYRLMDVALVIKRTTLYLVLVGLITGIYTFILMLPQRMVGSPGSVSSILLMVSAAVIIAATIQPLREWLDNITDKIFFQKKYDYYHVLEKMARELNTVFRMEEVLEVVSKPLVSDMHLDSVAIYLRERSNELNFVCYKKYGSRVERFPEMIGEGNPIVDYLSEHKVIIDPGEQRHQYGHLFEGKNIDVVKLNLQVEMEQVFDAGLIVPLSMKNNLIGIIVLGHKRSGDQFSHQDLALMDTLASQMSTTLENTRLYEQMLNNERLMIVGTMSAGIAHEIRNPLASIKTFIQMLPDKYAKEEFRARFNEIVPAEIERISNITADLLSFAKPSAPHLEQLNVETLLGKVTTLLHSQMKRKQLELIKNIQALPDVNADYQQFTQVVLNLLLNAIQASHAGGKIVVNARLNESKYENHVYGPPVIIEVIDEGIGIKPKDMGNLFQPFFTTKAEGTGLGLATSKRIMEAHHGNILVDSEEGKGAKFTVILPSNLTPEILKEFSAA